MRKAKPILKAAPCISAQILFQLLLVPDRSHFLLCPVDIINISAAFIFFTFSKMHYPETLFTKRKCYDQCPTLPPL